MPEVIRQMSLHLGYFEYNTLSYTLETEYTLNNKHYCLFNRKLSYYTKD